jgi:hypothetical protein
MGNCIAYVTSNRWCTLTQTVTVESSLMSNAVEVSASVWVRGHPPNTTDLYLICIQLCDVNGEVIDEYQSGECECRSDGLWQRISHRFCERLSEVRSIFWRESGKDKEDWCGFFGSVFAKSELFIWNCQNYFTLYDSFSVSPSVSPLKP